MTLGCPFVQTNVDPATLPLYDEECHAYDISFWDLLEFIFEKIRERGRRMCGSGLYRTLSDERKDERVRRSYYYLSSLENAVLLPLCSCQDDRTV